MKQYRGLLFIYTINHFVPKKVRRNDLEKKKTNPEREETRKKEEEAAKMKTERRL